MESAKTPLKIVSCMNGTLQMHEDNIKKLTSTIDSKCQNHSTAFLTVMGPPSSEAWFYTNLLLNHFEDGGSSSLLKFSKPKINNGKESPYLPGFSYDKFKAKKAELSGIYAWPKPFLLQNYHGNIMLWVLYLHQNDSSKGTLAEHRVLTHLLHLISTRTIITASDLEQVQDYPFLNENNEKDSVQLQNSVLYILQTLSEPFRCYHYDNISGEKLEDVKDLQEFAALLTTILLENYNSVGAAYVPSCNEILHDKKGRLWLNETSYCQLNRVLKLIGDISHIRPQIFNNKLLEPSRILQYLADCIEIVQWTGFIKTGKEGKKSLKIRKSLPTAFGRDKSKQLKKKRGSSFSQHDSDEKKYVSIRLKAHSDLELFMQLKYCSDFLKFVETEPGHFIDNILDEGYNDVLQKLGPNQQLSDSDSKKLQEHLKVHCRAVRNAYIMSHKFLASFHAKIENCIHTSLHSPEGFFDTTQFTNIENEILNQKKKLQPHDHACTQLLTMFLEHLNMFRENEENLMNAAVGLVANEYKQLMENFVSNHPICPKLLKKLNLKLSQKFVSAFCSALYPDTNYTNKSPLLFDVEKRINCIYRESKDANTAKLKNVHETIHRFITDEKKHYCEKMEQILQQNTEGSFLQQMHEKFWTEGVSNFESNMVTRIGNEVLTTKYVATLNAHINKYWINYQRKKDSNKVKKEKSSTQARQQLPDRQQKPSTVPASVMLQTPVIFQLSLTEVAAAVSKGNEIEILHKEELHFAITSHGSWLCGNAVKTDTLHQKPIQITNIWDYEKLNAKGKTANEKNLTTESMLGFLLATLKHKIEAEFNGVLPTCLFIVPFWFTSFQRQQVVDSGKIAGFEKVMLINENTAIALYAGEQERKHNRCSEVFVISENSNWVDATVYSFDQNSIKMISHCGNYNVGPNTSKLVPEACITAEMESKTVSRSSWGRISGKNRNKMKEKVLYINYQNENWERTLSEVRAHLRSVIEVGEKGDWGKQLALMGALYFYQQSLNQRIVIAQEWVSSSIFLSIKSKNHILFTKGGNYILPAFGSKKIIASQLPGRITEIEICQKIDKHKSQTQLGIFQFQSKLKQPCLCQVEIDFQGIVTVLHTQQDKFIFRSCNLSDSQIALVKNNVEAITRIDVVKNEEINELVRKLKQFQALIVARKVQFLSKTAEIEVQNQITEYIQILYSPTTPDTVKNISLTYETLRKKYIKKSMYI